MNRVLNVFGKGTAAVERLVIRKADGRVIDLGMPGSLGFRIRLWRYKRSLKED